MRRWRQLVLLLAITGTALPAADNDVFPIPLRSQKRGLGNPLLLEVGVFAGEPALANASIAVWGTATMPFFARVSGMYFSDSVHGLTLELGWAFDQLGPIRQYLAMSYGTGRLKLLGHDLSWEGAGPMYGFRYRGFAVTLGALVGQGEYRRNGGPAENVRWKILGQVGYTYDW